MMRVNEASWDRAVRMLAGIVLLFVAWDGLVSGVPGIVSAVAGVVALSTGIVGWCPAYTAAGLSTRRAATAGHCPHCESLNER